MSVEPITIYSHTIDPKGVLDILRRLAPGIRLEGPEDNWATITITQPSNVFQQQNVITFRHARDYYSSPDWPRQVQGMQGYFSRFQQNGNTARVMRLIQSLQFSIALFPMPEPDIDIDNADDARLQLVFAVTKYLDGVLFTPSSLRDAAGRVIYGTRTPDPHAIFPSIPGEAGEPRQRQEMLDGDKLPPVPQRIARRACALAGVCNRGLLEQEDKNDSEAEQTCGSILRWIDSIGIRDELEPDESKLLQCPFGRLPPQDALNACWRIEGLAVLAWALQRIDLPSYDVLMDPGQLLPAIGLLDADRAKNLIARPTVRSSEELKTLSNQLFSLHWRLRNFALKPVAMNFGEFAKTAWFGPLDISLATLVENDLAIDGVPISKAPKDAIHRTTSAIIERHLAINWLQGESEIYSKTDTST